MYSDKEYDITIVEIKPEEDKIDDFMELDDNIFNEDTFNISYSKHSIYIIQYPNGEKAKVSYAIIKEMDKNNIFHFCCTEKGSSGAPIINLLNHKIIGIHKKGSSEKEINVGTNLKYLKKKN